MKLRKLVRHLKDNHCVLHREGGNHSIYVNTRNSQVTAVPRHREVNDFLVRKICRDLGIPAPS